MNFIQTEVLGVWIIEPRVFMDARGYFMESYQKEAFDSHIGAVDFIQDNESCSRKGVLRGLHYQLAPYSQAKLVRVIKGAVLDVAVDLRRNSPTYLKSVAVELTEANKRQLFVPRGFAHGFSVLSPTAVFTYKCDNLYCPAAEGGVLFSDPTLDIDWRIPSAQAIISEKDTRHPLFKDLQTDFKY